MNLSELNLTGDDLKVRRSTLDDFEAVLDIDRNIYQGTDYLPSKYCDYMRDPNRVGFVCEYKGKVVAFRMVYMVDGGEGSVSEAARVHPEYRNKGLFKYMHAAVLNYLQEYQPHAENLKTVTSTWDLYDKNSWKLLEQRTLIYVTTIPWKTMMPSEMEEVAISFSNRRTEKLSKLEAIDLTSNKIVQRRLFPTGQLLVALEPFKVMGSNLREIIHNCTAIFASFSRDTGQAQSISFGIAFDTNDGITYRLEYYGVDDADALMHFTRHHHMLGERTPDGQLGIVISLASTMDGEKMISDLEQIKGFEMPLTPKQTKIYSIIGQIKDLVLLFKKMFSAKL